MRGSSDQADVEQAGGTKLPAKFSESEIVELGTYCKSLMTNERFNTLCDEFEAQSAQHMMLTQPHETQRREAVYSEVQGKRAFIGLLAEYVASADAILKRDGQQAHPEEDEIDY